MQMLLLFPLFLLLTRKGIFLHHKKEKTDVAILAGLAVAESTERKVTCRYSTINHYTIRNLMIVNNRYSMYYLE
jgi:hypothetical protein